MRATRRLDGFRLLATAGVMLAFCVIVLGAWVRLSDAGLGCPDWPGCYGMLTVPETEEAIEQANTAYPDRPVEVAKAWREMIHRYLASTLGLVIVLLALIAFHNRREVNQPVVLPFVLVALVIFQGLLGMWTVTLLLKPAVVLAHLLGGMATLTLLAWLAFGTSDPESDKDMAALRVPVVITLGVVVVQIALGGWTSSNYAALACPDFPTCQKQWWPEMDFDEGFVFWREIGIDYTGGILDHPGRVAIHMSHRIGAVMTALWLGALSLILLIGGEGRSRLAGAAIAILLTTQWALGIAMVTRGLPLSLATAHNGVAALLLLAVVYLTWLCQGARRSQASVDV